MAWLRRAHYGSLFLAVIGFLFGLITRFVGNPDAPDLRWLPWIVAALVVFIALYVYERLSPPKSAVQIGPALALRNQTDKHRYARKGLIAFVSLYRPLRGSGLTPEGIQAALDALNYEILDLENSNLETTIHAVLTHKGQLRHCWLIGTTDTPSGAAGSARYIPILVHYLHARYQVDCRFHFGPDYEVALDDDAALFTKAKDLIHRIVSEARSLKVEPEDLVVDITSGIRSLPAGAILSALETGAHIQLVGTHYDADGLPIAHDLFPIVVPIELRIPKT